jgi:hypothetical protein
MNAQALRLVISVARLAAALIAFMSIGNTWIVLGASKPASPSIRSPSDVLLPAGKQIMARDPRTNASASVVRQSGPNSGNAPAAIRVALPRASVAPACACDEGAPDDPYDIKIAAFG